MKLFQKIKEEDRNLVKDNFILFSATMILHVLGFLFHFYATRKLGPVEYGVFYSILSFVYLLTVPFNTIQTAISKFVSQFKVNNAYGKIHFLLNASFKRLFLYSVLGSIIFLLISPFLANFLHVPLHPVWVVSLFLFFALLLPVSRGVLQGLQQFKHLGFNLALEGAVKLFGGILFISLGWGVSGALGAFVAAYFIPFLFGFYPLRNIFKTKTEPFQTKALYKYSFPVSMMLLGLTAFYTLDVILVKHFFAPLEAGYYASLSRLGTVVFFGSFSLIQVMFAKVSELHAINQDHKKTMYKSLFLVALFSGAATLIFSVFPTFFINLFFGVGYLAIKEYIGLFALFISFLSLVYTLSFYHISLSRYKFIFLLFFFNLLELFLISLFHSSILQVIYILLILQGVLFIALFVMTVFYHEASNHHPSEE